ncbi:hypothetical protein PENTCL1PPCAC_15502, partial [Pristionchus entomophagus]
LVSLLGNGLLLLLLVHRSGQSLGNYRFFLMIFALTDIFISLFHAWFVPLIFMGRYGYLVVGHNTVVGAGLLRTIASVTYTVTFFIPFALLVLHFIYRLVSLSRPRVLRRDCGIFGLPNVPYVLYVISHLERFRTTIRIPLQYYESLFEYGFISDNRTLNAIGVQYYDEQMRPDYLSIGVILVAILLGCHTVVISLACIVKIYAIFSRQVLEIRVRLLHVQLFRALLIQFSIPALFSLLPIGIIVSLSASGVSLVHTGNVCSMLASLFPALDPILMIASNSRFRMTLVDWVHAILGTTARRNERVAEERSRMYTTIIRQAS